MKKYSGMLNVWEPSISMETVAQHKQMLIRSPDVKRKEMFSQRKELDQRVPLVGLCGNSFRPLKNSAKSKNSRAAALSIAWHWAYSSLPVSFFYSIYQCIYCFYKTWQRKKLNKRLILESHWHFRPFYGKAS